MTQRLRFLLDTNILIPLQDSFQVLERNLANLVRLANVGGHQLLFHGPATRADFLRDPDELRRGRNLNRLSQFSELFDPPVCPWNSTGTSDNAGCDNEILYAVESDAVHVLVTEDRQIHTKAYSRGLHDRVYTIQAAEDWLKRLHDSREVFLPNIDDVFMHNLTARLGNAFFDSLRAGYPGKFDKWFRDKARDGRRAWLHQDGAGALGALCVYAIQENEMINDAGERLPGRSLKLCTFKVDDAFRGQKIGELFLKAAFRYATENACESIFLHAHPVNQDYLIRLLEDFGFRQCGTYSGDMVLVKLHPQVKPGFLDTPPFEYVRQFFPHFRADRDVGKFIVPIRPQYHEILFPEIAPQGRLFGPGSIGNAIKLAYLCHARLKDISPGDILLFYRTEDAKAVTSLAVVERHETMEDAARIATVVRRRTVYSLDEIQELARKPTKVILFRLIRHLEQPVSYDRLMMDGIVTGPIQTIRRISHEGFSNIVS